MGTVAGGRSLRDRVGLLPNPGATCGRLRRRAEGMGFEPMRYRYLAVFKINSCVVLTCGEGRIEHDSMAFPAPWQAVRDRR